MLASLNLQTARHFFAAVFLANLAVPASAASRQDQILADNWKFIKSDAGLTASADSWTSVTIPHTWNTKSEDAGADTNRKNPNLKSGYYRGACWYARTLDIPADWKGRRIFIRFEAASLVAKVYLNGQPLGEHRGAFTAFCYELTPSVQFGGTNDLRVQVDNRGQKDIPPALRRLQYRRRHLPPGPSARDRSGLHLAAGDGVPRRLPDHEGGLPDLNDKGLVTQDRQIKKDAYFFYQANWTDKPMVRIASNGLTPRQQPATQIEVFSNCDKVELSVNGTLLNSVAPDSVKVFRWPGVTLRTGKNVILATATSGKGTATDTCEWDVDPNTPAWGPPAAAPKGPDGASVP